MTVPETRVAEIFAGIAAMAERAGWLPHELAVAMASGAGSLAAAAAEDQTQLDCSIHALHVLTEGQARQDFQRKGQAPVWN